MIRFGILATSLAFTGTLAFAAFSPLMSQSLVGPAAACLLTTGGLMSALITADMGSEP